jgi:hypothetical protein
MKTNVMLMLFISVYSILNAQDSLSLVNFLPIQSSYFTTDPLGNLYVVKDNNALIRFNSNGDSTGFFNEIKKGRITSIDATNPMRTIVYYGEYGQILVLDQLLSKKSTMNLAQLGLFNIRCISNSADGKIWVYDVASGTLLKMDDNQTISFTSSLRNVLEQNIDPQMMVEQDRSLFMVDSLQGIKKFDQYGFYQTSYAFNATEIQYFNNFLVYYKKPFLYSYNTKTLSEQKIEVPNSADCLQVRLERNRLYIRRSATIDMYNLNEKK